MKIFIADLIALNIVNIKVRVPTPFLKKRMEEREKKIHTLFRELSRRITLVMKPQTP